MKTTNRLHPSTISALVILLVPLLAPALHAQILFDGTTAYTQDFDGLPSYTGTSTSIFSFYNNETLLGWYSSVGTGKNNAVQSAGARKDTGDLYDWGGSGSKDRAFGLFSHPGYAPHTAFLGLQLQNKSAATIDSITLSFDVEQWRVNKDPAKWSFSWVMTDQRDNQLTADLDYTEDSRGDAASTKTAASASGGLKGTTTVSVVLTGLKWKPDEYLWLRWESDASGANACALGIDNLKVEIPQSQVPEPATIALLLGAMIFTLALMRRKRA